MEAHRKRRRALIDSGVVGRLVLLSAALLLLAYSALIDGDPPSFPLEKHGNDVLIDCLNFDNATVTFDGNGRVKVSVDAGDFIQYPNEIASSLLSLRVTSGNTEATYGSYRFWDLKREGRHISFCVLQTFGGDLNASLYCDRHMLKSNTGELSKISVWPVGWSKGVSDPNALMYLHNVCFDEKKRLAFLAQHEFRIREKWIFSKEHAVDVFTDTRSFSDFSGRKNAATIKEKAILIFDESKNSYDMLTNIVLPFFILKQNLGEGTQIYHYNRLSQDYLDELKLYIPNIRFLPINTCFVNLYIAKTIGAISPFKAKTKVGIEELKNNYYDLLLNLNGKILEQFRKKYMVNRVKKNMIAVDSTFSSLLPNFDDIKDEKIKQFIKSFEFVTVDQNSNIIQNSKIISASKVYISTNVTSMFHGIFLNNESILVEYPPTGAECLKFGKNISDKIGVKYSILYNDNKEICKCEKFNCYFTNSVYEKIRYDSLYQFLSKL